MSATQAPPPRPGVAEPGRWEFPTPESLRLGNGLAVLHRDLPGQYVVSVRLAVPLRLADEPRDREGVAAILARLLDEGAGGLDADEIAGRLERLGVAYGASAQEGSLGLDLDVPQRNLRPALELLTTFLADPAFPEAELARMKESRLAEIEQERASAPHRAARELIATVYDSGERASRPSGGTAATVTAITRDDVVAHHRRHVGPAGSTVTVAGDLSGLDVPALLEETLGRWVAPDHVPPAPAAAPALAADRVRVVVVDRPGSVQSELVVAAPGPDRRDPVAWAPCPVAAFVVGGTASSRVDAVLREEKGFTYGIRTGFRPRRAGGLLMTTGSVRTEVTAEALPLLLDLLDGARAGFTEEERRTGVDFVTRTAPGRFATADAVADELVMIAVDDLPLTSTTDQLDRVRALTVADLDAAWARWATGEWTVVVVGDAAVVTEPLRSLGRGEVTVVPS